MENEKKRHPYIGTREGILRMEKINVETFFSLNLVVVPSVSKAKHFWLA